jgi:hypothetical protein
MCRGSESVISRSRPALFFECDENQESVAAFLIQHGYLIFDWASMDLVDSIPHNSLALHREQHASLISNLNGGVHVWTRQSLSFQTEPMPSIGPYPSKSQASIE